MRLAALTITLLLGGCLTECGAISGGSIGASTDIGATGTSICADLRGGGECPTNAICKIAIVGDSIPRRPSAGSDDLATSLTDALHTSCVQVDSFAVDGNHCDNVVDTQYPDNVEGQGYHVIINNCGVNDLNGTEAASGILADRESLAASVLAEGGPTLVDLSVMPWGAFASHTAGKQTETDSLNTSLSTPINAATIYVDTYTGMEDDITGDDLEADYDSGDGLHPNAAGTNALATLIATELKTQ